jgi:chitin disaccharide deacetylase
VRRLIVNADDFGLSEGVNAGVVRSHREGIVTSASLMVRQPAARAAATAAREYPTLSIGLHVDLAEWERRDGEWHLRYAWVDHSDAVAVAEEVERQLGAFRTLLQRDPTHLDSHQHVHRDQPTRTILVQTAGKLGVPLRHHSSARYNGGFYGQSSDGSALHEAISPHGLAELIVSLPAGTNELCCHPAERAEQGWPYGAERIVELKSLCHPAVRQAVADSAIELISFLDALPNPSGAKVAG